MTARGAILIAGLVFALVARASGGWYGPCLLGHTGHDGRMHVHVYDHGEHLHVHMHHHGHGTDDHDCHHVLGVSSDHDHFEHSHLEKVDLVPSPRERLTDTLAPTAGVVRVAQATPTASSVPRRPHARGTGPPGPVLRSVVILQV